MTETESPAILELIEQCSNEESKEQFEIAENLINQLKPLFEMRRRQQEETRQIREQIEGFQTEFTNITNFLKELGSKLENLEKLKNRNSELEREVLDKLKAAL